MPKVMILAGEPSGDVLGADLLQKMRTQSGQDFIVRGIAGDALQAQGCETLFDQSALSVMGVGEVLPKLPILLKRIKQTVEGAQDFAPDIIITIDAPDFNYRVVKKLQHLRPNTKFVHYVAPSVWAWKPKRAQKIAKLYDLLLCLLPFEPPLFEKHGLKAVFAGHPAASLDIQPAKYDQKTLCLLPGSRMMEINRLWPTLQAVGRQFLQTYPNGQVIVPTLPHLSYLFEGSGFQVITGRDQNLAAMAGADAAVCASGTVTLELACLQTPMVVTYKLSKLSWWLSKILIKTPFVALPNIISGREVVPELLQERATFETLWPAVEGLLSGKTTQELAAVKTAVTADEDYVSQLTGLLLHI